MKVKALACLLAMSLAAGADELQFAASSGNVAGLRQLIEVGHQGIDSTDAKGVTALIAAAGSGQLEAVDFLLAHKADLKLFDSYGHTALHRAVKGGHLEVARHLLQAGAPVDARVKEGDTPLMLTQGFGKYLPLIELLVQNKADVNVGDMLYLAAFGADPAVTRMLLKAGGDPKARHGDCNALDGLCLCLSQTAKEEADRRAVAEMLLDAGCKYGEPGLEGEIPLIVAAQRGHKSLVELFLERGADANAADKKGNSLLHNVASGAYLFSADTARVVVKRGGRINAVNQSGATPLHMAAYGNNRWVVEALLGFPECNRGAKNRNGKTALDLARQMKHQKVIALLER